MYTYNFCGTPKHRGMLLSFNELKKGNFIEANILEKGTLMTTMLTDIPENLWNYCHEKWPNVQRRVIKTNGFFSGTFIFEYFTNDFTITITRKLRRPYMLLFFFFYAEIPSSYEILIELKTASSNVIDDVNKYLQETS